MKNEGTSGVSSYMDYVANAASYDAFRRHDVDPLLSIESLPEVNSLIDFKAFAREYPEKLFPLLAKLRPEFQELFCEYYLLQKPQHFIGKVHGQIQTRIWQALRLIEQAIGALILLGPEPDAAVIRPILEKVGVEQTPHGSLTEMITMYAKTQSYVTVAAVFKVPVPAIRKIFRPVIRALLKHKSRQAVAVGAYLRSMTHQASLTGAGLSKRCLARTRRVKNLKFDAPSVENSPLISFGRVETLGPAPWCMLEISSEHRMAQIAPSLRAQGKRIFKKKPAQIFAPLNNDGELAFGYIFARSTSTSLVRALTRIRGISEMSATCKDDGTFLKAVTVPDADIQKLIAEHKPPTILKVRVGDFVEIMTGEASRYCGTVTQADEDGVLVLVNFPTGRKFSIATDKTGVKLLPGIAPGQRTFWSGCIVK